MVPIERADLRQQLLHVRQTLQRACNVGALRIQGQRALARAEHKVAAHPRRQVQHHVRVRRTHPVHHLLEQLRVPRAFAGFGIADMDMGDCGARLARLDRRCRDLLGRDRQIGMPVRRVAGAGDGAGDECLEVHGAVPCPKYAHMRRST
jgi:hypothetical protein